MLKVSDIIRMREVENNLNMIEECRLKNVSENSI